MGTWLRYVNIKDLIDGGTDPENVRRVARQMIDRLTDALPDYPYTAEFEESLASGDAEDFDTALSGLYDWADEQRVWLGP